MVFLKLDNAGESTLEAIKYPEMKKNTLVIIYYLEKIELMFSLDAIEIKAEMTFCNPFISKYGLGSCVPV